MFHYFVSHVPLQLCGISVVMKTANTSMPSGMGAKGLCCNGTTSESFSHLETHCFLDVYVQNVINCPSAFWSSACSL